MKVPSKMSSVTGAPDVFWDIYATTYVITTRMNIL